MREQLPTCDSVKYDVHSIQNGLLDDFGVMTPVLQVPSTEIVLGRTLSVALVVAYENTKFSSGCSNKAHSSRRRE